jgi:Tol biopolymer transport system component
MPAPGLVFDNWNLIDFPETIIGGTDNPLVAFINENNSETIRNLSTAQPNTNRETLYFASPTNPSNRIPILELDASTSRQIYLAPRGNSVAYFAGGFGTSGLYVLDLNTTGLSGRILAIEDSLAQRGIFSAPVWNPDGSILAVVVETGYSLDILGFDLATSTWLSIVSDGSYNFHPAWSPDGRYLAFVSDRETCPSWNPSDVNACNPDTMPPPVGGHVYVLNIANGDITRVSDEITTEPSYWINNRLLAFTGGDQLDLLNPSRTLWVATMPDGASQEIRLQDRANPQLNISESWSDDGARVIFQHAIDATTTEIVVMDTNGARIDTVDSLSFARFSMQADWSPDRTRIAIGGSGGQCPFGIRVLDDNFNLVATGNPPPTMCDPIFSPDGAFIAFTGVNPRTADGRADIYTTNQNGFGATNLTADLRGQMILLGWVGQ